MASAPPPPAPSGFPATCPRRVILSQSVVCRMACRMPDAASSWFERESGVARLPPTRRFRSRSHARGRPRDPLCVIRTACSFYQDALHLGSRRNWRHECLWRAVYQVINGFGGGTKGCGSQGGSGEMQQEGARKKSRGSCFLRREWFWRGSKDQILFCTTHPTY